MKEKKQWQKPALMMLVRRKPEEGVLETCKWTGGQHGTGCNPIDFGCPVSVSAPS